MARRIAGLQITPDLITLLKQQYILKNLEAYNAEKVYRDTVLEYHVTNCKFKAGDIITVNWSNGAEEYKVVRLEWYYPDVDDLPVILVNPKLKSGKFSKCEEHLMGSAGYLSYDSPIIQLAQQ